MGQLNAWVHNACDPGDLLAKGGQYLGDNKTTMVGVHGSLFEKLPDGTFENIRPATAEEIELAGVVVQPLDASVGTNSFTAFRTGTGNVSEGEVGQFVELAQRSVRDGMTPDHIPSFASVLESMGRIGVDVDSLSAADIRALRGNTNCVVVKTCDHQAFSRTYGGRNNQTQIQVDAQDLRRAADADLDTWEPVWRQNGWSEADIAGVRQKVHEYNQRTFENLGIDYGAN